MLSSFYYASLEEQALSFLRQPQQQSVLNCVMRLTDDYLFMSSSKKNAVMFIENLYRMAKANNFRFNAKKVRTNFDVNLSRIQAILEPTPLKTFKKPTEDKGYLVEGPMFDWIGISIDMETLGLVQSINLSKEAVLNTLSVNMATRKSVTWLKRKVKSFMMNNIKFYFRETMTHLEHALKTMEKLLRSAVVKFVACAKEFRRFHEFFRLRGAADPNFNYDVQIVKIAYIGIRTFFKYLVSSITNGSVIRVEDYH